MLHHGHLILRQRARFVAADNLRAAQRLHCRQLADYGIALAHAGYTDGKHNRHHRSQALRNGRNGQAHCHHECGEQRSRIKRACPPYAYHKDKCTDGQHQPGKGFGKLAQLFLQRSLLIFSLGKRRGNFTHLRIHACRRNDGAPTAINHRASHIDHIGAVAKGDILLSICQAQSRKRFGDRHALPC